MPREIRPSIGTVKYRKNLKILKDTLVFEGKVDKEGRLTFWCPFCLRNHYHGYGLNMPFKVGYLEHRVPHCGYLVARRGHNDLMPIPKELYENGYFIKVIKDERPKRGILA